MLHGDRAHTIIEAETAEALADLLVSYTWSLTTGFYLRGVLFLNDSSHLDAAPEFAVLSPGSASESLTITPSKDDVRDEIVRLVSKATARATR